MLRRTRVIVALLLALGLSGGVVLAQPFTAQIQLALQALGLWPFGGLYSNGECPSWNATTQQFEGGACSGGGGGGAPTDATYLTQTPNGSLSAEQPMNALASGIMRVATTTGVVTSLTSSAGIAANISDETGTGVLVFATSPALTTPNLGTPSAATLTNATGLPISTGLTGAGTGVLAALGVNVGSAGAFVVLNGALGTPSSGTGTNLTGIPIGTGLTGFGTGVAAALAINIGSAGAPVLFNGAGGTPSSLTLTNATGLPVGSITGLGAGVATWLATPSSANLASAVTDETGTGALVFGTAPTITTSLTLTSATANTALLVASGYSLTGSDATAAVNLSGTWNTSGDPVLLFARVTNTASGASAKLISLGTVGDGELFYVDKTGFVSVANGFNSGGNIQTQFGSSQFRLSNRVRIAASDVNELDLLSDNQNFNAAARVAAPVEAVTGSKTPSETESNEVYGTGDADGQTFTLTNDPSIAGLYWTFVVTQTQTSNSMSIAPPTGETLRDGTSSCSTLTATAVGAVVKVAVVTAGSGGVFMVLEKLGTWTCNP